MTVTLKPLAAALAAAAVLTAAPPVFANSQLAAAAGVTPEQAERLTLNQLVGLKFNRDQTGSDQRPFVIEPGRNGGDRRQAEAAAGVRPGASLNEIVAGIFNRGKSRTDRQSIRARGDHTMSTRAQQVDLKRHAQLIASAGLTPEEARGLTLNQIVAAKYNRDVSYNERQRIR